jgi:ketosteroid isomerase-like protein
VVSSNLELIETGLAAFSRRDFDAAARTMHPDVEWHLLFNLPELTPGKRVFHGIDEVRELWALTRSGWDELSVAIEEVLEDRDGYAIARARFFGVLREAGVKVDRQVYYIFDVSDGLLKRLRPFDTEAEARAAAD